MQVTFTTKGDLKRAEAWLTKLSKLQINQIMESAGAAGVSALIANTPADSGLAANSWSYSVSQSHTGVKITWTNNDIESGFPVAIMLQYGYGTGTGGYVAGRDYINPAMQPVFDQILADVEKAVTSA